METQLLLADTSMQPVSLGELDEFRQQWLNDLSGKRTKTSVAVVDKNGSSAPPLSAAAPSSAEAVTKTSGSSSSSSGNTSRPVLGSQSVKSIYYQHSKLNEDHAKAGDKTVNAHVATTSASALASKLSKLSFSEHAADQPASSCTSRESEALMLFGQASQFERQGNLNQALLLFRQASKLNPDVERAYRKSLLSQKHFDVHLAGSSGHDEREAADNFETFYSLEEHASDSGTVDAIDAIVVLASRAQVTCTPKHALRKPPIWNRLPGELITQILQWAVLRDVGTLCSISLVCKKFLIQVRERSLWRFVSERSFPGPLSLGLAGVGNTLLEEVSMRFDDDWLRMFVEKPRVRTDGVFISRVNYVRQGYGESWSRPVHVVSYYRYLRFFSNGTCFSWMTTLEPAQVVKILTLVSRKEKGFMVGSYRVTEKMDGSCHIFAKMRDHDRPETTFEFTLALSSTKRGRHNKLSWLIYSMYNSENKETRSEIPLRTLRPFMFSKVRSYLST
ncbi:hypothetical protein SeMB42_g04883 [Synchytrium endobioticum]|uniref:F-box domain-containing protein n=1 Tax=Synchytrium endobioticum TaxID=286115 RepID=A0A507D0Z3_9FUNG|nr:hypothetical protein SeMB42_g04883 [Synchytrium endobioticum]TPX45144.1 hypothetical protein SeLEV6574_g04066 [Synchytrium endobioticum]